MNKKILTGLIILVILIIGCYFFTIQHTENNMKIPKSYKIVSNHENNILLSNGNNKIMIYEINSKDLNNSIKEYIKRNEENYEIQTVDMKPISKTIASNNNTTITKYWLLKNNKIYQVQMNNNESSNDQYATDLLNSINESSFNKTSKNFLKI